MDYRPVPYKALRNRLRSLSNLQIVATDDLTGCIALWHVWFFDGHAWQQQYRAKGATPMSALIFLHQKLQSETRPMRFGLGQMINHHLHLVWFEFTVAERGVEIKNASITIDKAVHSIPIPEGAFLSWETDYHPTFNHAASRLLTTIGAAIPEIFNMEASQ